MRKKKVLFFAIVCLIWLITICFAGCDGWNNDNKPPEGEICAEILSLSELNVYLGKGVLLPGEEADKIMLYLSMPYVNEEFFENPKSYRDFVDWAELEVDEHDLHIVTTLEPNRGSLNDDMLVVEYENSEWEEYQIGGKKVVKRFKPNESVEYAFVDNFYLYQVVVNFDNDKTDAENVEEVEKFISSFERYVYY